MNHGSGSLPRHIYCFADRAFMGGEPGFVPVVWFGLHSHPGRMFGCHVMLECGAIYRNLPPHALAFSPEPEADWDSGQAQLWDCYGRSFSTLIYDYLYSLDCIVKVQGADVEGSYLFTLVPLGDAYSEEPGQSKEFMFIRTYGDRLTIQPTNRVLFKDKSFTTAPEWPKLKRQDEVWSCE